MEATRIVSQKVVVSSQKKKRKAFILRLPEPYLALAYPCHRCINRYGTSLTQLNTSYTKTASLHLISTVSIYLLLISVKKIILIMLYHYFVVSRFKRTWICVKLHLLNNNIMPPFEISHMAITALVYPLISTMVPFSEHYKYWNFWTPKNSCTNNVLSWSRSLDPPCCEVHQSLLT